MKVFLIFTLFIVLCLSSAQVEGSKGRKFLKKKIAFQREQKPSRETGEMIVQLKDNVSVEDFVAQTGMVFVRKLKLRKDYYLFKYDEVNHKNGLDSIPVLSLKTMAVSYERNKYHDNVARAYTPSDSLFSEQFHLKNTGQYDGKTGVDTNVSPVWDKGYFGEGITIAIVDDGLDHAHEDLSSNFLMKGSWDYCLDQNDPVGTTEDTHGTSCAGVAAATDGDGACGLGVAPKANLMGRRILCSGATDAEIAEALSDESEGVFHVSSNSWGPMLCEEDNGCTYYTTPSVIKDAILDAVENGRDEKGIVFVWAVGNEAQDGGDVNFDRGSKMAQVIGVAAVNIDGGHSFYSNVGSALVVSGVSSGYNSNDAYEGIRTTDRATTTSCRDDFGGTSSACPLVAGVVALILEANPNLNYWQVQQIIIETATREHLPTENWIQNSEGYYYHRHFGFGLVDASAAVDAALEWDAEPSFEQFETDLQTVNKIIPDGDSDDYLTEKIQIDKDLTIVGGVEIQISITHEYIGEIGIIVESPSGTEIHVVVPHEDYNSDLDNYPLFVKNFYGESSKGEWYIYIYDEYEEDQGSLDSYKLIFYGMAVNSDPTPTPTPDPSDEVSISNFVNNSFLLSFFLLAIIQFIIF
ncbi:s8 family serine peptidase [Anaeramoeba flamelloides]|uniref:S8 family serine peptidase n=1 Tax=Anaeramoeba flamelloides TaxID=1746091 RepID=A0AAV7ZY74_9EUKA|nr:s8 family serine peptidase [Anaeramoeba flamelloides]